MATDVTSLDRFALVTLDERDQVLCGCSLDDAGLADLLRRILAAGPRAIVLDLLRDRPIPPGSEELTALLAGADGLLVAMALGAGVPAPPAVADDQRIGFADMIIDGDDVVRRAAIFLGQDGVTWPSLALLAASAALAPEGIELAPDVEPPHWPRLGEALLAPLPGDFGPYAGLDSRGYQLALLWPAAVGGPLTISATALRTASAPPEALRDRVVLVGSIAAASRDVFRTAVPGAAVDGMVHGLTLQARIAAQLVEQAQGRLPVLHSLPGPGLWPLVIGAAGLGAAAAGNGLIGWAVIIGVLGLWTGLVGWAIGDGLWLPLLPPVLALLLAAVLVGVAIRWRERRERRDLRRLLGTFVSPGIATALWAERDRLLAGGGLRPVALTATVMFTDLRGFTALTESTPPPQMIAWLDRYMTAMTELVSDAGGMIEKFTGDGLMAVFGVPVPRVTPEEVQADARAAAGCAVAMARRLLELNTAWRHEGLPQARVRVGIATGLLTTGTVGSGRRRQYTVLGDAANTAQRLEALGLEALDPELARGCEADHCRILLSGATAQQLGPGFVLQRLGPLLVRGKGEAVAVHRLRHDPQGGDDGERSETGHATRQA